MATLYTVVAVWFVLIALVITVDAAPWLMAALGLFTLPAIWDLWRNPEAGLDLTPTTVSWFSGRRSGSLSTEEIDRFRFDTRLDFSVRASAVLHSGKRIRLPYECTPPHVALETALTGLGIRVERYHFSLTG